MTEDELKDALIALAASHQKNAKMESNTRFLVVSPDCLIPNEVLQRHTALARMLSGNQGTVLRSDLLEPDDLVFVESDISYVNFSHIEK